MKLSEFKKYIINKCGEKNGKIVKVLMDIQYIHQIKKNN